MANVASHEYESVRRCPSESRDVTHGMSRYIEDVEGPVTKQVEGGVLADFL